MGLRAGALPDFPWDSLAPFAQTARAHPGGLVDLSVGTPVDPTPSIVREALAAATDSPGYPTTHGTVELREAVVSWFERTRGVPGLDPGAVLPTVGSKELVATLPSWLGLGPGDAVVFPEPAYPTYDVGARVAGATPVAADDPAEWPAGTKLVWINSPGNPDGRVWSAEELRAAVVRAREIGAVIASDECYAELGWDAPWDAERIPSILDPRVAGDSRANLLSVYSLSKQSNLAGYRAAFVAGCSKVVGQLLKNRKHLGLMPPAPVQHAMAVALGDDEHVDRQREIYRARREALKPAVEAAGFRVDGSEAGLYLWITEGRGAWESMGRLAELGILAGPGVFYGDHYPNHVRLSLTASDERIAEAAARLRAAAV
ncbi:MAG TPA: succinyldiaminopimelate transaminase [Microbacterium sp.]|nr:succinyldiaminopimelate transaminase [Microbacterium sp.]